MGPSLGASSTLEEDAALSSLLRKLSNRIVLLIGDSSLRNQFMQLARVGLSFSRGMPSAKAIASHAHDGVMSLPYAIKDPDRPDSSNGFWGGFPWMIFSTPGNATFIYAKSWGCADVDAIARRMRGVARRHRMRSGGTLGGWPPQVVLWNFGLHLLHVYPARPVPTQAVRCAQSYSTLVGASARALHAELPSARLVYRFTNAVCDGRFEGPWAIARRAYHCAATDLPQRRRHGCNEARVLRVQSGCRHRYNISLAQCARTFMDAGNSRAQRDEAQAALRALRSEGTSLHVSVLDAFAATEARCDATVDGRHYPRLLATLNRRWLSSMAEAGTGYRA